MGYSETIFLKRTKIEAFNPHILLLGKSGSGKSNSSEYVMVQYFLANLKKLLNDTKYKVIDVYDSGRFENFCYSLAEIRPNLKSYLRMCNIKAQSFPTEIIMICGKALKEYNVLPKNVKVMSFDQNDLTVQDLFFLLGASTKLYSTLTQITNTFGDDMNLKELYVLLTKNKFKGRSVRLDIPVQTRSMMIRNVKKWLSSGMFAPNCEKIDFKKICNDSSKITVFCTAMLEADEEAIAYGIIMKNLFEIARHKLTKNELKVYIREISNFLSPLSMDLEERKFAKHFILRILREGRDYLISILADSQRGQDLPPKYKKQFGTTAQMKSDFSDAEQLLNITYIEKKDLMQVSKFALGTGMIITGQNIETPVKFRPTMHRHKKPKMDVLKVLRRVYGEYKVDHKHLLKVEKDVEEKVDLSSMERQADAVDDLRKRGKII